MALNFKGFVLRPPRIAPANAVTTASATSGVVRNSQPVPSETITDDSPDLVDAAALQYKAAILNPEGETEEYLIFASNTSNLTVLEDTIIEGQAKGEIVRGTSTATDTTISPEVRKDASDRVVIVDKGDRSILEVLSFLITRGDTETETLVTFSGGDYTYNPISGVAVLSASIVSGILSGGLSRQRGDSISEIIYKLESSRFWWTKNDEKETRFTFNGGKQRWEPLKGSTPVGLGRLTDGENNTLSPKPGIPKGLFLTGDSGDSDVYSMIRIGVNPGTAGTPIAEPPVGGFGGIRIIDDALVEEYDFSTTPTDSGVIGEVDGVIKWNPDFVEVKAGQDLWYSPRSFQEGKTGIIGKMIDARQGPLFVSPIPKTTEYPFVKFGSRKPLDPILVDTEAELLALTISPGQVGVALSTGRLGFNDDDIDRADPDSGLFDIAYLGALVAYDGVSMVQVPQPTRAPAPLVDSGGSPATVGSGDLFVPTSKPLFGLGISGVNFAPDRSGAIPRDSPAPDVRKNDSGLVRKIRSIGDLIFFTPSGVFDQIEISKTEDGFPKFDFQIRRGTIFVGLKDGNDTPVKIGTRDKSRFGGEQAFILQADVMPSVFYKEARLHSRLSDSYVLDGTEKFKFALDNNEYNWDAALDPGGIPTSLGGTFTAQDIAISLDSLVGAGEEVVVVDGRVTIQHTKSGGTRTGKVEIGYGFGTDLDLSGCSALGFLPGWHVNIIAPNDPNNVSYVPDSGASLGVFRSTINLDRALPIPDFKHRARLEDTIFSKSVMGIPVILLDNPPLVDEAGYDENVFFALKDGLSIRQLKNFEQVYYQFQGDELAPQPKLSWADTFNFAANIQQPTSAIFLGRTQILSDTIHPNVFGGLDLAADGGEFVPQVLGEDYILQNNGQTGSAILIDNLGSFVVFGGNASFTAGTSTFTDGTPGLDFVTLGVLPGYLLKILSGDSEGYYRVTTVTNPNTLEVTPNFPSTATGVTSWELYEGLELSEPDEGIIADQFYKVFNHLPAELFIVHTLDLLGDMPASVPDQDANRLVANVSDALASGREIEVRLGLSSGQSRATMIPLGKLSLGTIANGSLFVPGGFPATDRFSDDAYSIQLGITKFTYASGKIVQIGAIIDPVPADSIGVLVAGAVGDGELKFGDDLLINFAGSLVTYVEEFLDPTLVVKKFCEFNVETGALNFSADDITSFGGTPIYFQEKMITEGGQDVTISPISGGIFFTKPLRKGLIVEVTYFLATEGGKLITEPDSEIPIKIIEFLPISVRLEAAVPLSSSQLVSNDYRFNPEGKTVFQDFVPEVFVKGQLVGYLGNGTVVFDFERNSFTLSNAAITTDKVEITYLVLEAFGGEAGYSVSTPPVYRPPFRIPAGSEEFVLETDRTSSFSLGDLLRVGATPFYIRSVSYDAVTDETTVGILPTPIEDAGSLAPGNEALSVVSVLPVSTDLNPQARAGFFETITAPFEDIAKNSTTITFQGNVLENAVTGHLIEIGGVPFVVKDSELTQDGSKTVVNLTSPAPRTFTDSETVKLSIRPVYPPAPTTFLGPGQVVSTAEFDVVLFGELDSGGMELPGRVLRPGVDYDVDFSTGAITFNELNQGPLLPGQTLYFRRLQVDILLPQLVGGVLIEPRVKAGYSHLTIPSEDNGYLNKTLVATYTFSNPDSFYFRIVPLLEYLAEVGENLNQNVAATNPSNGPIVSAAAGAGGQENKDSGNLGLEAQLKDLKDTDRAARHFCRFYNDVIVSFEQILEAISGAVIGDRDGKFRYSMGSELDFPPPGFEDSYSGEINNRNVYSQLFFNLSDNIQIEITDFVVDPDGAIIFGSVISGDIPDADLLDQLIEDQRDLIKNDIDDIVLIGLKKTQRIKEPFKRKVALGRYRKMGEAHILSRLFPERANAFTITSGGIGADEAAGEPGVYSRRKRVDGDTRRTTGKTIATISNPVLDVIEDVSSASVNDRLARARIFAYSKDGFPDFDAIHGTTTAGNQAVIATPLLLKDFPIDPDTGFPDISQLQSQGGDLIDITTGDEDLFLPPFTTEGGAVAFGHPDGGIDAVGADKQTLANLLGFTAAKSIFVEEIQAGCVILFNDGSDPMTSGDAIIVVGPDGKTGDPVELVNGDTIFLIPPDVEIDNLSDPPTAEEMEEIADNLPGYRVGFDVELDGKSGELKDKTYLSFRDPFFLGFKELFGQKPPQPLTNLDIVATFRNGRTEPLEIPALTGGLLNDDGDFSIPYLSLTNTEIVRLQAALPLLLEFFVDTPIPSAVYPDEILGNDGDIRIFRGSGTEPPGELESNIDANPVPGGGYVPNTGIGDLRQYDFFLVETDNSIVPLGSQGILTVGDIHSFGDTRMEPPRFVTQSQLGNLITYNFENAITYVNQISGGMVINRSAPTTTFDATSALDVFFFNDGTTGSSGGLNTIIEMTGALLYPNNDNIIRINLWRPDTGAFLQTVEIQVNISGIGPIAIGDIFPAGAAITSQPDFFEQDFTIDTNFAIVTISLTPGPGELPEDPGNPGHTIPLWFTIDVDCSSGGNSAVSETAEIQENRLTFEETYDMRTVLERATPPVNGVDVHGKLSVFLVTGQGGSLLTVNGPTEVNGGDPFTFKDREPSDPKIGTFNSGRGSVTVMAWEGHNNTEIDNVGDMTFSGIPSSEQDENGVICQGEGFCESKFVVSSPAVDAYFDFDSRLTDITVTSGGLDNIQRGDVVIVKEATAIGPASETATTKAGTYLVRHVINPGGNSFRIIATLSQAVGTSSPNGFLNLVFPVIVRNDAALGFIEVNFTSISGNDMFDSTGRVFFIPDPNVLTTVLSVEYTVLASDVFTLDLGTIEDAGGSPKTTADLAALPLGTVVSGFTNLVILYKNALDVVPELPFNFLVGYRGDGTFTAAEFGTAFGIRDMEIRNPNGGIESFVYSDISGANVVRSGIALTQGEVGIVSFALTLGYGDFSSNDDSRHFDNMPNEMRLNRITQTQWDDIHGNIVGASEVNCLVPGDEIFCNVRLQGGIFLEPSIPRPTMDLDDIVPGHAPRIVDNSHDLDQDQVGFRSRQDFGGMGNPAPSGVLADPEGVNFEVRRIRRFHDVQENFSLQIEGLAFAYEIRRGVTTSYNSSPPYTFKANDATQLGAFDDPDVNINPGDFLRILDDDGSLIDTAEISTVDSDDTLLLAPPGLLTTTSLIGKSFEVFIKQAPVPHEQSNQELFEFMTDETVLRVVPDYTAQEGGQVNVLNQLQDNTGGALVNFEDAGVQEGDILVVDPQGPLQGPTGLPTTGQEFGARPFGDEAVPNRAEFDSGRPSETDDNRGYYFVTGLSDPEILEVSGEGDFGGLLGNDVIFGSTPDTEYAVYPTITSSGDEEGQVDFRLTSFAGVNGSDPDSFKDNRFSVAPFGYQIIRPSGLFSRDAQELILFMRERMLSWIEELGALKTGNKKGSYFIFQRDLHIQDLGDPNDPNSGLGLITNNLVFGLTGLFKVSPFANVRDCLSIIDRRFWILDLQLDTQKPPGAGGGDPTYSTFGDGEGRPVLPDRIDDILDNVDQFRALRLSWVDFRTNVQSGTLSAIERFIRELPKRKREQLRLLLQNRSLESV